MERSENITELTKSMFKFHGLVGKIKKDAKNPFFKSNYATLSHILEEIAEPLQQSGLIITQWPEGTTLVSMLIHAESGEFFKSSYEMPIAKKDDPQAFGSSISYARRYAVSSILSLNIDDDDANNAAGLKGDSDKKKQTPKQPDKPWLNPGTDAWQNVIKAIKDGYTIETVMQKYAISKDNKTKLLEEAA